MKGLFIYDNALDDADASVTGVSGSLTGRHADALLDGCPHNQWGASPFVPPAGSWIEADLGSVQPVKACGLMNHNFYVAQLGIVLLKAKVLPGDSWTTVDSFTNLDSEDHDPCVADIFSSTASYRYWRFEMDGSPSAYFLGALYLARETYEFQETPDAPFGEEQHGQIVFDETQGGSERRQIRGEPYYDRTLRWKCVSAATALEFRKMWLRQHGRSRPFLYVAHDKDQPTGEGLYIPEYVRFAGLTIRELEPGGGYSVLMTLTGLLRIDY